ncbi:hypothetical protein OS187_09770 [Xanthomonadaceae bacterium JHOS43]|nr:hypothetical protein [Xanthomonadaceae bacterium JHOS43]MCX7564071.1 hypothetical protein [Xanthomonadaceae bacterium XH05]
MEQLALNPEPCAASCLREHRIGSNAWWYIIDAEGKTHLQFAEDAAGAADFPVQRASDGTASIRSVGLDALAPDVSEATGCGRDGWGWDTGDLVAGVDFGDVVTSVRYSHIGLAVLVSMDAATGVPMGELVNLASGVRRGTPPSCASIRDEVLG